MKKIIALLSILMMAMSTSAMATDAASAKAEVSTSAKTETKAETRKEEAKPAKKHAKIAEEKSAGEPQTSGASGSKRKDRGYLEMPEAPKPFLLPGLQ